MWRATPFVVATVLLMSLFSCRSQMNDQGKGDVMVKGVSEKVVRFLGNEIIEIIKSPDTVESYTIKIKKADTGTRIAGYPVISRGPNLTPQQIDQIQSVLLDQNTYLFDFVKKCLFLPEYALKFRKGTYEVVVLLCFSCEELTFVCNGRELLEDFDNATPKIRGLIQALFR
ncbi:MAG TPA: hypothetical protein PK253_12950 [Spirochaetota bacterium]|nr:hypothetical protein [Spirochaetota bacterium]